MVHKTTQKRNGEAPPSFGPVREGVVHKTTQKRNGEASPPWGAIPFLSLSVGVRVTLIVAGAAVAYAAAAGCCCVLLLLLLLRAVPVLGHSTSKTTFFGNHDGSAAATHR